MRFVAVSWMLLLAVGCGGGDEPAPLQASSPKGAPAGDCPELSPELGERELGRIIGELRKRDFPNEVPVASAEYVYPLAIVDGVERWAVSCTIVYNPLSSDRDTMKHEAFVVVTRDGEEWGLTDFNPGPLQKY